MQTYSTNKILMGTSEIFGEKRRKVYGNKFVFFLHFLCTGLTWLLRRVLPTDQRVLSEADRLAYWADGEYGVGKIGA